jgi:hypothetical protein
MSCSKACPAKRCCHREVEFSDGDYLACINTTDAIIALTEFIAERQNLRMTDWCLLCDVINALQEYKGKGCS